MWVVSEEGTCADVIHGETTTVPEKDDADPGPPRAVLTLLELYFWSNSLSLNTSSKLSGSNT